MTRCSDRHLALWLAATAWACAVDDPAMDRLAVTQPDAVTPEPGVVAILSNCTGTLISPRVVLTAAHCVAGHEGLVTFDAVGGEGEARRIIDERPHPDYDRITLAHDIALMLLDEPAPEGQPSWMPVAAFDPGWVGATVRVVGYGRSGATADDYGIKRTGTAVLAGYDATSFTLAPSPSLPCFGDSGGPVLIEVDGIERILGVTSGGDQSCADHGRAMRVDAYLDALVLPYLDDTGPGAAGGGERCWYDDNCASAECRFPADAPTFGYCSPVCTADAACPAAMACVAGRCLHPLPSPGATGAACAVAYDCTTRLCAGDPGAGVCAEPCATLDSYCPDGSTCVAEGDQHFCAPDPGGCRAAGGSGWPAALLLVAILALRRRRQLLLPALLLGCAAEVDRLPETTLPPLLDETGLYLDGTVHPELIEFQPRFTLWADGADERRWLWLPPDAVIDSSDLDYWNLPAGSKLWKELRIEGRPIETRHLVKAGDHGQDWLMGAYLWDSDGSQAALSTGGAEDVLGTAHDVPSQTRCLACHGHVPDRILGLSAVQLDGPGGTLEELAGQGRLSHVPAGPLELPGDQVTRAALGTLHANCGGCHHPGGDLRVDLDLSVRSAALASVTDTGAWTSAVGVPPSSPIGGDLARIVAGDPASSSVFLRMASRGSEFSMPPLGSEQIDEVGVTRVAAWIESLSDPGKAPIIECCGVDSH